MTISNIRKLSASGLVFMVINEWRSPPEVGIWIEQIMFLNNGKILELSESDLQKASESVDEDLAEQRWPQAIARGKIEIEKRRKK